jgi:hypothetical protein
MTDVNDLLSRAAPGAIADDPAVRERVTELVAATGGTATRSKRRLLWIPAVGLGGLALTAGALAVQVAEADIVVPISYTTDTGQSFSCSTAIDAGSAFDPDDRALSAFIRSHNWSGLGQDIYDRALAEPFDPATTDLPNQPQDQIDHQSWMTGMTNEIIDQIPPALFGTDAAWISWNSQDCTGVLH